MLHIERNKHVIRVVTGSGLHEIAVAELSAVTYGVPQQLTSVGLLLMLGVVARFSII